MPWSREPPTEPGWYWTCDNHLRTLQIAWVDFFGPEEHGLMVYDCCGAEEVPIKSYALDKSGWHYPAITEPPVPRHDDQSMKELGI